jgi:hypothetical protein
MRMVLVLDQTHLVCHLRLPLDLQLSRNVPCHAQSPICVLRNEGIISLSRRLTHWKHQVRESSLGLQSTCMSRECKKGRINHTTHERELTKWRDSSSRFTLLVSRRISFKMNLVFLENSGFNAVWINFVWNVMGCSLRIMWSCTQKWEI